MPRYTGSRVVPWRKRIVGGRGRLQRRWSTGVMILLLVAALSHTARSAGAQAGQPNLTIDLLADKRQVAPGNSLHYYRALLRTTAPVQNVVVRFDYPAGFSLSGSPLVFSGTSCAPPAAGSVRCTIPVLDSSANILFGMNATSSVGTFRLPAWIDPENAVTESNEADNASGVLTTVTWTPETPPVPSWPGLSLHLSSLTAVTPGSTTTMHLLVRNTGTADTRAVQVSVSYPAGITHLAPSAFNAFACTNTPPTGGNRGVVTCTRPTLQAAQTALVEFVVRMPATLGSYAFEAHAASVFAPSSATSTSIQVVRPDLRVGVLAPYTARVGTPFTYTVSVRSHLVAVANVVVEIPVPSTDFTYRTVTATGKVTCAYANALITCTGTSLAADETVTIQVTATPLRPGVFLLRATVDPRNVIAEGDENNNSSVTYAPVWM
jgi:hypothetical protein